MAQQPVNSESDTGPRLISAAVLAPVVLAAAYVGGHPFSVLVAAAVGVLAWEWCGICVGRNHLVLVGLLGAVLLAAVAAVEFGRPAVSLGVLVLGFFIMLGAGRLAARGTRAEAQQPRPGRAMGWWLGLGVLYVGLPFSALVALRADPDLGRDVILWLFLVVWSTDTGAYLFGRLIGGAKLAPNISPNKTWAGFWGGLICAAIVGTAMAVLANKPNIAIITVISIVASVAAQLGDLSESWFKRRFSVKNASNVLPGHGGILDRVDGLVAATIVTALIVWFDRDDVLKWL